MKLSDIQLILNTKSEYDRTVKELKMFENEYYDFSVSVGSEGSKAWLLTHKRDLNSSRIRTAIISALEAYRQELVTELTMFGVTDFEN